MESITVPISCEIMTFAIFRPSIYLVSIIAMDLVIRTGSLSVLNGSLSLGTLFVFITYISSFFEPIQELSEQLGTLQSSIASAEKIFSVLDVKPEIVSPADRLRSIFLVKLNSAMSGLPTKRKIIF